MITQIGRLCPGRLGVIARTSSMLFKRSAKSASEIGRELGVDYLLEGSVRREGDRIRITAQLIETRTEVHLWAETYDRSVGETLNLQTEVAAHIARSLAMELVPDQVDVLGRVDAAPDRGVSGVPEGPVPLESRWPGRCAHWQLRTTSGRSRSTPSSRQRTRRWHARACRSRISSREPGRSFLEQAKVGAPGDRDRSRHLRRTSCAGGGPADARMELAARRGRISNGDRAVAELRVRAPLLRAVPRRDVAIRRSESRSRSRVRRRSVLSRRGDERRLGALRGGRVRRRDRSLPARARYGRRLHARATASRRGAAGRGKA